MKVVAIILIVLFLVTLYASLVVASKADDREETKEVK